MKKIVQAFYLSYFLLFSFHSFGQFCTGSLGTPVVNVTFGSGANPGPTLPIAVPGASTTYTYQLNTATDGFYTIVNSVPFNSAWFTGAHDHTGDVNGYMAFFNADPTPGAEFYRQTVNNLCSGTTYEFATWVASVLNVNVLPGGISPNITFSILNSITGAVLATSNTGNIPNTSTMIWNQYSLLFTTPVGVNSVVMVLSNNNVGGAAQPGNDLAIDDITFRPCGPLTKASFANNNQVDSISISSCTSVNLFGSIIGSLNTPAYQWQLSSDGGNTFTDISGANNLNYIANNLTNGLYQFQLLSAEAGNINSSACRFVSNKIKLLVTGCTLPTSITCSNWLKMPSALSGVTVGDLDITGNKVTIEAMCDATGDITRALVSKHNDPSDVNYFLCPDLAQITTSDGFFSITSSCPYVNNKTYHVALVYDGSTLKLYRNGFLLASTPATGNLITNNWPTTIGEHASSISTGSVASSNIFKGVINEVRIWNVARTQAELQSFMNGSLPNPTTQPGLLGYYTFDGLTNKQGNTLFNATLQGAASINEINPDCNFVVDSCNVIVNVPGISSVINTYTPVIAFNLCDNKITVEDASTFNIGDTVLIIQMKGAEIDSTNTPAFGDILNYKNAGNYEFNYVKSKTGNIVELKNSLTRGYDVPNGKVQLIRVPYYNNVTVTSTLTCLPWDGRKGGVLVFKVQDTLNLQADIDVSDKGFNGGKGAVFFGGTFNCFLNGYYMPFNYDSSGMKGESITSLSQLKMYAKGKNAGGGGGGMNHNGGGAGGGNGGTGGTGGFPHINCSNRTTNFSLGGIPLSYTNIANKAFLGSGGGAAQANNGSDASGANGGGLIIISSKYLSGNTKSIISNGGDAIRCNTVGNPNASPCHDGGGGGGAGGSVLLDIPNIINSTSIKVNGGNGADLTYLGGSAAGLGPLGPGAGGGGGVVWVKTNTMPPVFTISNAGGINGVILNDGNMPWGANPGLPGISVTNLSLPTDGPLFKPNIDSVKITDTLSACRTLSFKGQAFVQANAIQNWQWTFGDNTAGASTQNTIHVYSAAGTYNVKLVVTDINGCKDSILEQVVIVNCPLSTSSIINTYTPITALNPCDNKITVQDASTFNTGDTVLIIQMKGAIVDSNNTMAFGTIASYKNAGNYEFNFVKSKAGNIIELKNVLLKQYDIPVGEVQLIRVPYFNTATITDTLTCLPWDGSKGGVVVLNAAAGIVLNAPISVSQKGFKGGQIGNGFSCGSTGWAVNTGTGGSKGEGIANVVINQEAGGAKLANGGGGSFSGNTGGGGGSNAGIGGTGGREYNGCGTAQQSIGGQALDYTAGTKVFLGGGGGGGEQDNGLPILPGGKGGGIVIINAPSITGNNQSILANGESITTIIRDEGGTGGGAGGSVLMFVNNYTGNLAVEANGGAGSANNNVTFAADCHGPGGGGGAGFLGISNAALPANITFTANGGKAGKILNPVSLCFNTTNGATDGGVGSTKLNFALPISTIPFKKNIDSVKIKDSATSCRSFDFKGTAFVGTSPAGQWQWTFGDNTGTNTQNSSHTYTASGTYNVKLVVTDINGCKDSIVKQVVAVNCPVFNSTIINTYTPVIAFNPCENKITVEDASTFNIGDTVLMIQMKGAIIDSSNTALFGSVPSYSNAGNYDFNFVKSKAGNIIELKNVLLSQYNVPNGKVQLIRVPYFQTYRGTDTLTCLPWDGRKGGVLVLNARDSVVLNADINVKGKGFRGGNSPNPFTNALSCGTNGYFYPNTSTIAAAKGESIYDIGAAINYGRGNNASGGGGGNGHNSGGGGGGNGGPGGFGGKELEACNNTSLDNRGIGGTELPVNTGINKIFMGGGGGSGHTDNANGSDMNGANGGGIAFVITNHFKNNNYKIIADGDTAVNCNPALNNCHDASGGGGSGGTILMQVSNYVNNVNIETKGGKGGDLTLYNPSGGAGRIGPGGGGGGGLIWINQSSVPGNISPSFTGGINGSIIADANNPWGSTPGLPGLTKFNLAIPFDNTPFKKNIDSVKINDSATNCSSFDFKGIAFVGLSPINQWQWSFGDNTTANAQDTSHSYSTPGTYNVKLVVTDINGCKDSVTKSVSTFTASGDFYYNQDICNPFQVQFFGVNQSSIIGNWQIGPAVFNNTNSPLYTFAAPGNYIVKYIFTNGFCADTITKIITVGIIPANIIITPDTTICFNTTKQLRTIASLDFCWSPISFLDDPALPNPVTATTQQITYFFTAAIEAANLVINPNFSGGNTGFTSQYVISSPNTALGQYIVGNNPPTWNASLSPCLDHTSGTGGMLLINSDAATNKKAWTQTVTVIPNTNYSFGTWLQSLSAATPAQITFSINGNDVDTVITASNTTCTWQHFYTRWNSGNNTTATIAIVNKNTQAQGSYFALDDISFAPVLIKRDSVIISIDTPVIKTIDDTASCRGVQIQLTTTGAANYQWQPTTGLSDPASASPVASPTDTIKYYVTGTTIHNCSAKDSVIVAIKPSPNVLKTADTSICKNTGVQLNVSGGDSYTWRADTTLSSDTIPNPFAKPGTTTTYYVQTKSAGFLCEATDSIKVSIKSAASFTISPDDTVCSKSNVLLTTTGGNIFSWQPANLVSNPTIANPVVSPVITTTFTVNIKDSVCGDVAVLRTTIHTIPLPRIKASKSNDIDCFYLSAQLNVTGGNSSYFWTALNAPLYLSNSVIPNPVAFPSRTKTYFVTGEDTNTHCKNSDSIQVLVYTGDNPLFWVPNSFTPNSDSKNDCFKVYARSRLKYFELHIYNRWGNKVFETKDVNDCWDGTYKGQPQDPGNFVYYIRASNYCKDDVYKGNLLLIR